MTGRSPTQDELDTMAFALVIASLTLTVQLSTAIALEQHDNAKLLEAHRNSFDALRDRVKFGELVGTDTGHG